MEVQSCIWLGEFDMDLWFVGGGTREMFSRLWAVHYHTLQWLFSRDLELLTAAFSLFVREIDHRIQGGV